MNVLSFFRNRNQSQTETVFRFWARVANQITPLYYAESAPVHVDEYGFEFMFAYHSEADALTRDNPVFIYTTDVMPVEYHEAVEYLRQVGVIAA